MAKLIYILGLIAAIWCILDILKKPWGIIKKIIVAVLVFAFSWVGFAVYYFLLRNNL